MRQTAEGEQFFHCGYAEHAARFEGGYAPAGTRRPFLGCLAMRHSQDLRCRTRRYPTRISDWSTRGAARQEIVSHAPGKYEP